jgi:small subunit ribosomal protein S16
MAVTIRLTRMGAKKKPFYRLVVADSHFPRDGRYIEVLGTYDPNPNPPAINLNREKIDSWIQRGAHPTPTVKSLLKKAGLASTAGGTSPTGNETNIPRAEPKA